MIARTLNYFHKNARDAFVMVAVTVILDDADLPSGDVLYRLDDAALTAVAAKDGRTAWDERDILAVTRCELPAPPPQEDVAPPAPAPVAAVADAPAAPVEPPAAPSDPE